MAHIGEMIGPYTLGECLGQGGFGAVYEATHCETGQRVALKFLRDSKLLQPEAQNRFVREVGLLARLDHENIVRHYDAGLHKGVIYCAMELVECGSLKEVLLARGRLPWCEATEVAVQVCRALAHAHARNCVHRDLKPANLYLSEDGMVKLGDLGLARDLDQSRLTASGQTVGTWRYMPPEQIVGEEKIDGRLDVYALGCILFEMIAGRVPFDGPDFATIFDQHLEADPPRLDEIAADCPQPLADLVDQMLEKLPAHRPENAAVVADRLEEILKSAPAERQSCEISYEHARLPSNFESPKPNLTRRLQSGTDTIAGSPRLTTLKIVAGTIILLLALFLSLRGGN